MSTLTINCSKPDCDWSGPPAEAATHTCPTRADADLLTDLEPEPAVAVGSDGGPPLLATRDEIAAWLIAHGNYDQNGQPQDDATRQADEQYAALVAAERDAEELARAPEPDIDGPAQIDGDATEQPWQVAVAEQIRARDDAKQIRWAIVDEDAGELVAAHGMKAAAEADLITWNDGGRDVSLQRISELLKEADTLAEPAAPAEPDSEPDPTPPEPEPLVEEPVPLQTGEEQNDDTSPEPDAEPSAEAETPGRAPAPEAAKPEPPAPATGGLFDPADYDREDLAIPKVDGQQIDRIRIDFSGSYMLDRSDPNEVSLYNRVHMRKELELWVTAVGAGVGAKPATNRDGENDITVGQKALRIESIRIVNPEDLGNLEGLELVRAATRKASAAGVPDDQIENAVTATLAETG